MTKTSTARVARVGRIVAAKPRIRLMKPFEKRRHRYQHYVLRLDETIDEQRIFRADLVNGKRTTSVQPCEVWD